MRRQRTIYFDDARHFYLYVFEPPITLEEAYTPIDQVAGTVVDTFVYGVGCGGLFYPSKVGKMFGQLSRPFTDPTAAAFWRAWTNLQSLIQRDLDPLKVLIDRAHEKEMAFFASLRLGTVREQPGGGADDGIDRKFRLEEGGRGFVHEEVRDHFFAVLEELTDSYETDGIELDFAGAPGALDPMLRPEDVAEYTPVITEYVTKIARLARSRGKTIGARIYPIERMNTNAGLDLRAWLENRLLDYVTPLLYGTMLLDANMPIDWIVKAAHEWDISVYGFLQPDYQDESRRFYNRQYASAEMIRAAAANYLDRGVDGLYTWFLPWPLGHPERSLLSELADPEVMRRRDKHYVVRRGDPNAVELGYDASLPLEIPYSARGKLHRVPFYISDDLDAGDDRVQEILLRINVDNIVGADRLTVNLNGHSLAEEKCLRTPSLTLTPYQGLWLEFDLRTVRPVKGDNVLEISLDERPPELESGICIDDVEMIIRYGLHPEVRRRLINPADTS